jgi:putative membrane protein
VIDYDGRSWGKILFRATGAVAPRLVGRVVIAGLIGVVAAWAFDRHEVRLPPITHTMVGAALGLLLVFRTNASYDRYWEGRRLLGGIVIRSRDLARQIGAWLAGDALAEEREHLPKLIVAHYRLVAQGLRNEDELDALEALLDADERAELVPVTARPQVVSRWLSARLAVLVAAGELTEQRLFAMDQNLTALTDCDAGCERIARTPVPFAYAQHIKVLVVLFCFTAPFAVSADMRWYTPIASAVLAFALFGIDEIGVEIEDPFGYDPNDLPVDAIGDGIDRVTKQVIGS